MLDKIYILYKKLIQVRFIRYFIAGIGATVVDWGTFYILAIVLGLYYQFSLIIAFTFGTAANYALNKIFTFRCQSPKVVAQFSVHIVVASISLLISSGWMFLFVDVLDIHKMTSRMTTSAIMLAINYFMVKSLTFNKRFFK